MRRPDHLVAVPNVSEGRDPALVRRLVAAVEDAGARVLDVHSDAVHNRSVLTTAADPATLVDAMAALARAATAIDLSRHSGVHPRLGVLDVCPFVIDGLPAEVVVDAARAAGRSIADAARIPVYLYGEAALRPECKELPALRRNAHGQAPDYGPEVADPRAGLACVGARGPLIAFNVWLRADLLTARRVAAAVRAELAGAGVRTLGLDLGGGLAQVSMNLTDPARAGVDDAFAAVAALAAAEGIAVHATELVGLPPERFMPDPDAEAARLLREPGRSLERVLAAG